MNNTTSSAPGTQKRLHTGKVKMHTEKVYLDSVHTLRIVTTTKTFKVTREIIPKTNKLGNIVGKLLIDKEEASSTYNLAEITLEEFDSFIKQRIPFFVLKVNGKLYHCQIPVDISFMSAHFMRPHKCSFLEEVCDRLSSAPDEKGGCAKIRKRSSRITDYPWITYGCQTFGTLNDIFVVFECQHYQKCSPRPLAKSISFKGDFKV